VKVASNNDDNDVELGATLMMRNRNKEDVELTTTRETML